MNAHIGRIEQAAEAEMMAMSGERSSYQRSRGGDPIATFGALTIGMAAVAAFAFMNPHFTKKAKRDHTVVQLLELPDDPPPAAEVPPPPAPDTPPPMPQVTAPPPIVPVAMAPTITAPPPAPQPAPPAPPRPAPPASNAVVAKGPENVGDLSAQVVFRKPIRVPMESRRAHEEGIVVLSLLVGADGRVMEIRVVTSSGFPRLDRAALEAVEDWRWSPLMRDGTPVMVRGLVRVPFIRERGGRGREDDGPRGGRGRDEDDHGPHGHRGDRDDDGRRHDRDDRPRGEDAI